MEPAQSLSNLISETAMFSEVCITGGIERKLGITNTKLDYKVAHGIRNLANRSGVRWWEGRGGGRVEELRGDFVVDTASTVAAAADAGTTQFTFTVFKVINQLKSF